MEIPPEKKAILGFIQASRDEYGYYLGLFRRLFFGYFPHESCWSFTNEGGVIALELGRFVVGLTYKLKL